VGVLLQVRDARAHLPQPSFEVLLLEEAVGVGVDQAGTAPPEFLHLGLDGVAVSGYCGRLQALAVLRLQALWLLQQPTDLRPDGLVQAVHAQLTIGADARATPPRGVGARAAVVGVAGIIGPAVIGIATLGADEQALQQVTTALEWDACPPPILSQLLLGRRKGLRIHQRRHGNADPLRLGDHTRRGAPARRGRSAARRPEAGLQGHRPRATEGSPPGVGGVLDHVPDGAMVPAGFPCPRGHVGSRQALADAVERAALLHNPGEDLAHHARFLQHDLEAGRAPRLLAAHEPVAVGRHAEHAEPPRLRRVALAPPAPLEELGPLIMPSARLCRGGRR